MKRYKFTVTIPLRVEFYDNASPAKAKRLAREALKDMGAHCFGYSVQMGGYRYNSLKTGRTLKKD